jgi:citrate lyase subunit beta / citryl-CoA lyase
MNEAANTPAPLRRSLHFVPGANERMLAKAAGLPADGLVFDLEDAVTPDRKDAAREMVGAWLGDVDGGGRERIVRINPLSSPWGRADLEAIMRVPPDAIMVPKVQTLSDVEAVDAEIARWHRHYGHAEDSVSLILIATETPAGVINLPSFTRCPRVSALTWGAEDLSAAIGARRNRDDHGELLGLFRYCQIQTLLCAAAGGIAPIDTVYVDIRNHPGLARDCRASADMGFIGKMTIHPDQIPIVNEAFTPTHDEAEEAQALLDAFAEAQRAGHMAFSFKGQMVDVPHLERARTLLARARRAGVTGDS